ncbi:MAG: Crp/Fnr family transcriptional regulator [Salibacteraceae bacterium]
MSTLPLISELMEREIPLSATEKLAVDQLIPVMGYAKGDILLQEGQVARRCYFVIKGCVRAYQLVEGKERNTDFYLEGDPVASLTSYLHQSPANHYLACMEKSVLAVLSYENEQQLYQQHPKFEALCRNSIESAFGKQQAALQQLLTQSPETRYLELRKNRPELLQRVPQYHLASFLGIEPESLSRIRKRLAAQ